MPWGPTGPTAEVLQNLVHSVVRQTIPEGMTMHFADGTDPTRQATGDPVTVTPIMQYIQANQQAQLQQILQAQFTGVQPFQPQQQNPPQVLQTQQQNPQANPSRPQQPGQATEGAQEVPNTNNRSPQGKKNRCLYCTVYGLDDNAF